LFLLARTVFHGSVAEVKERLTPDELAGWIALYAIDPWGEVRADIREAVIGSALLQPWARQSVKPADLIPEYDQGDEIKHDQRLGVAAMKAFVQDHNNRKGANGS
jgi:hypothetical protein